MPKAAASAREVPDTDVLLLGAWNPEDTAADDASISAAAHPAAAVRLDEAGLMMVAVLCSSKVHKPKKHVPR